MLLHFIRTEQKHTVQLILALRSRLIFVVVRKGMRWQTEMVSSLSICDCRQENTV
jgi:hypothetical protein